MGYMEIREEKGTDDFDVPGHNVWNFIIFLILHYLPKSRPISKDKSKCWSTS